MFDLSCDRAIMGNNAIFAILSASGIFTCVVTFFSDTIGRKWTFILVSALGSLGGLVSLLFSESFFIIVIGLVIQYLSNNLSCIPNMKGNLWFFANMYTYANECAGGNFRSVFLSITSFFYGVGGFVVNLLAIRFNDYRFFICLSLLSIFLVSIGYFFFLETPFFCYKTKNIEKLYQVLSSLCKRNYSKIEATQKIISLQKMLRYGESSDKDYNPIEPSQEETLEDTDSSSSLLLSQRTNIPKSRFQYLREILTKQNVKTFFKLLVLVVQIQFIFSFSLILNKDLGIQNIYLSGILIDFCQVLGYFSAGFIIIRFGRRWINMFVAITVVVASGLISIIDFVSKFYTEYEERSNFVRAAETGSCNQVWDSLWSL